MIHLKLKIIFLSIELRANEMIGWMVRNFISREANVLKIGKT